MTHFKEDIETFINLPEIFQISFAMFQKCLQLLNIMSLKYNYAI